MRPNCTPRIPPKASILMRWEYVFTRKAIHQAVVNSGYIELMEDGSEKRIEEDWYCVSVCP